MNKHTSHVLPYNFVLMLSNLNSCHGVFIPTTSTTNSGVSTSTRHYRAYSHHSGNSTHHNETKRNKMKHYETKPYNVVVYLMY